MQLWYYLLSTNYIGDFEMNRFYAQADHDQIASAILGLVYVQNRNLIEHQIHDALNNDNLLFYVDLYPGVQCEVDINFEHCLAAKAAEKNQTVEEHIEDVYYPDFYTTVKLQNGKRIFVLLSLK